MSHIVSQRPNFWTRCRFGRQTYLLFQPCHKYTQKQSSRGRHPDVFCKKDLGNFAKFTGKHLFYRAPPVAASVYS